MLTTYATLAALILMALAIFQIALIFGAPLGRYAWGGAHTHLPKKLRVASISSIVIYVVFALFVLSKAGIVDAIANQDVLNVGMWIFTAYFFLGVVLNGMSRSKPERYLMTPVALVLGLLFLFITLG